MAKFRTIKMEFWQDEKIGSLPVGARLLYIGMWSLADDNGVLRGNAAYLRSQIFPYDEDLSIGDVKGWIASIVEGGMLAPFTYKGESYLLVRKFREHQKIDARYASELIPFAEVEAATAEAEECNALTDNAPCETHGNSRETRVNSCEPHESPREPVGNTREPAYGIVHGIIPVPVQEAHTHSVDTQEGVAGGEPQQAEPSEDDAAALRHMLAERYPRICAMREPMSDEQLRWIAGHYTRDDIRRVLSDMDDKRVYDTNSRFYRDKAFGAFKAFADNDRLLRRRSRAGDAADGRRYYTYEEMCDEIPNRAKAEDFTMVVVGGRKMWQKTVRA